MSAVVAGSCAVDRGTVAVLNLAGALRSVIPATTPLSLIPYRRLHASGPGQHPPALTFDADSYVRTDGSSGQRSVSQSSGLALQGWRSPPSVMRKQRFCVGLGRGARAAGPQRRRSGQSCPPPTVRAARR